MPKLQNWPLVLRSGFMIFEIPKRQGAATNILSRISST